jgi:predicted NBD/HSP70 family sugar kinase
MLVSSHKDMRSTTLLKVIRAIRQGATSRHDVQDATKLSWGTCSDIINLLIHKELLVPFKRNNRKGTKGGRKTTAFGFSDERYLLCGMEVRANSVSCSLTNLVAEELFSKNIEFDAIFNRENLFHIILSVFHSFLLEYKAEEENVPGLFISLTGAVDSLKNRLIYSPRYHDIADIDFNRLRAMVPFVRYFSIQHDIQAQASSVVRKNGWKEKNFVFLHFGEGVGMTFYNEGFYSGHQGFAGEIGHIRHHIPGINRTCSCGRENCYETILSTSGIQNLIREICHWRAGTQEEMDDSSLICSGVLQLISDAISDLVVMVSNTLNPGAVFLGGEAVEPYREFIEPVIEERVRKEAWLGGPGIIRWFSSADIRCAYGAIINLNDKIIAQFITDNLI